MTEQVLPYDPVTFKRLPPRAGTDATQNDHYVRHSDPQETSRDYSRPYTIPAEEFEGTTGKSHTEACAAWDEQEKQRVELELKIKAATSAA